MKKLITVLTFLMPIFVFGQRYNTIRKYEETAYKALLGGHLQRGAYLKRDTSLYLLEVGIHRTHTWFGYEFVPSMMTYGLSLEYLPSTTPVYGLKAGFWFEKLCFVAGMNVIYYTDWKQPNLTLRPEIGLGWNFIKLTAGYNLPRSTPAELVNNGKYWQWSLNALIPIYIIDKR